MSLCNQIKRNGLLEISASDSQVETPVDFQFADPTGLVCSSSQHRKEQHMANIVVGVRFPVFILPDEQGEPFDLRRKLADGPLMLVFYRGDW